MTTLRAPSAFLLIHLHWTPSPPPALPLQNFGTKDRVVPAGGFFFHDVFNFSAKWIAGGIDTILPPCVDGTAGLHLQFPHL